MWYRLFYSGVGGSGAEIVAIDVSPELLEIANANCSAPNVRYEIQNAYALSYPEPSLIPSWAVRFYIISKSERHYAKFTGF